MPKVDNAKVIQFIKEKHDYLFRFLLFPDIYPTIHLLPGTYEIIFVVTKQQINVTTAIHGIAATVGSANVSLNTVTHSPSQNMCIRYMP